MEKRNGFRNFILVLAILAWGPALYAADKGSQFGLLWGFSVPDADNTNPFHLFGVKGAAFLSPQVSLGGYYMTSDKAGQQSSTNKFSYSLHGLEAAYHIPNGAGDTFIAFRMGLTKVQESPSGNDGTFSPYHYGLASGYDYNLGEMFSIGFEGSYLHVLPGRSTIGGTVYDSQSFNIMSFMLTFNVRL